MVLSFLHGWSRMLPVSFCGDEQPSFVVQVLIFQEKIKCSSQLETPTLRVVSKGFILLHSRHVQTKPWSEKDLALIFNATCVLLWNEIRKMCIFFTYDHNLLIT